MNDFGGYKSEFLNATDKTTTGLYKYVEQYGGSMSVIKLSSRSNKNIEIKEYMTNVYKAKNVVSGVIFTLDGQTYADLVDSYDASTYHAVLNISGHESILQICQAIVDNGEYFSYSR